MRILVLNGSGGDGRAALVACRPDGLDLEHEAEQPGRGGAERLAGTVQGMLRHAGWDAGSLGLIVAVTGPGSFTGLRATLALAQGVALGAGVRLHGVSVSEALRRSVRESFSMPVWWVGAARRDRVFLDRDDGNGPQAFMLDALPLPSHPVLLAGDAAAVVAQAIEQAGGTAQLSAVERPDSCAIAACGLDQLEGRLPSQPALPLYVDPPEAKRPAAGLRPQPR